MNNMKKVLSIFIVFISSLTLYSGDGKGPLWGKNYYIPFLPFYSFPGMEAAPGEQYDLNFIIAQYYIQDMVTEFHVSGSHILKERFVDYEGYILEPTISYNIGNAVEVGLTSRLHFYYGGIFDSFFEAFHKLFSFPNGGRGSFPSNDVYIRLHTSSGIDLTLTDPQMALGDTDLFGKWSFLSLNFIDLALFSAVKIPTGSMDNVSGSGYFDLAFALLADFSVTDWFAFYLQNGLIIPGQLFVEEHPPLPIYSLLASLEFILSSRLSILAQFRFATSPIEEETVIPENISYSVKLHKPMTNIMLGIAMDLSGYRLQFSFEEDAFTNNGADLIFNATVGKSFNLSEILRNN